MHSEPVRVKWIGQRLEECRRQDRLIVRLWELNGVMGILVGDLMPVGRLCEQPRISLFVGSWQLHS